MTEPRRYLVEQVVDHKAYYSIHTWAEILPMLRKNEEIHGVDLEIYLLQPRAVPEHVRVYHRDGIFWIETADGVLLEKEE